VDYSLSLAPAALTIAQGATGTTAVSVTRTNFTGAVTLSLGSAPAGVTGSFNPAAPTGTSSTLTVSVGAAVAAGVYNLTVDGTGTPGNRSTPLTLTVSAPGPDYALSLAPAALTIVKGENGNATVTITRTNFTGAVTLTLTGAPTGVTGAFTPAAPTGTSATLTVSVSYLATPGVYNLTVNGTASVGNRSTPLTLTVSASGISDIATVDAGDTHSCALRASGVAYCWGANNAGQLGDGTTTQRLVPTPVAGGLTFTSLSAGPTVLLNGVSAGYTCGVAPSGAAYCWGNNGYGQLGDGTTTNQLTPTPVAGGLTFASVHAGAGPPRIASAYSCGVTSSGATYCWGTNFYGQLGDGTTTLRLVPTAVAGGLTFTTVSVGAAHTCGVTTSGAAYCWGYNGDGRLGDNTTTQRLVPTAVAGGLTFASVTAGDCHTCAVTTSGAAYCWGAGGYIGDGTTTQRLVPTAVAGGLTFASVDAAAGTGFTNTAYTCGVTPSGAAYCWGYNTFGTLGDGTTTQRLVPNAVAGALTFAAVRAGGNHTCGVTTSGAAYCWGLNSSGELGDGTTTARVVPMPVAFPTPP
jgi:alpha-tubulin suppressor-like RCC1 family protein